MAELEPGHTKCSQLLKKMKPLTILIPTDFSEVCLLALPMVDLLSQKIPVRVHMLHVIEVNDSSSDYSEGLNDVRSISKREKEALHNFAFLRNTWRDFELHIETGLLTDQINRAASKLEADVVIMGTNGSDGFMEKISGSEAQHVVRHLQVPVISLRPGTMARQLKNILLVADFEHFEKSIQINTIKTIANAFNATIHLLQILTLEEEKYADEIIEQMKFFAKEHELLKFETHLYRDHKVVSGVQNFNKEADMDLVCIRTHGRKGINHLLFGSIAERLVNHCIKPLLTFQLKENA